MANRKITKTLKLIFLTSKERKARIGEITGQNKWWAGNKRFQEVSSGASRWSEKKINLRQMEKFALILEGITYESREGENGRPLAKKRIESKHDEWVGTKPYGNSRTKSCIGATNFPLLVAGTGFPAGVAESNSECN